MKNLAKKAVAYILAIMLTVSIVPLLPKTVSAATSGITSDGLEYSIDSSTGEVTIDDYEGRAQNLVI